MQRKQFLRVKIEIRMVNKGRDDTGFRIQIVDIICPFYFYRLRPLPYSSW